MDLLHIVLLVAAGIVGGVISSMVGGAALITFPALLAAGLPPVLATAANTTALTPGLFLAALYDRSQLPPFDRLVPGHGFSPRSAGALVGARCCCSSRRDAIFEVAGAARCSASRPCCSPIAGRHQHVARRAARRSRRQQAVRRTFTRRRAAGLDLWRLFRRRPGRADAGVLSVGTGGDYRSANATKNLVTALNSAAAVVLFRGRRT